MKVLFLSDVPLENPTSGAEQVLFQQAVGCTRQGIEVFTITRQYGTFPLVFRNIDGVEEACYSAPTKNVLHFLHSLLRKPHNLYKHFAKEAPFKACICHQPFTSFALLMRRKIRNIPILYNFNSPSHEEYLLSHEDKSRLRNFPHVISRLLIERYCLKRAHRITTLSEYMKKRLHDIHRIPYDKIVINPGGVDLERFKLPQDRESLKLKLGFPEGKIHLLTVRNLDPRMGLDNLLGSIHLLKKRQIPIHLTLGGEGPEKKNLEDIIMKYNLDEEVTLTGFIPSNTLPDYYGAADFFILPTRWLEGFGLVTVESMACGTPVLGTPVGGTVEIISGFNPQFLFKGTSPEDMADGIQKTINTYFIHKEKYCELRTQCRKHTEEKYSWHLHQHRLKAILDGVIQ